jgi:hypothetical protein
MMKVRSAFRAYRDEIAVAEPKRNWWWVPALLAGTAIVLSANARKRANTPYIYR